jgi:hypothetical protein
VWYRARIFFSFQEQEKIYATPQKQFVVQKRKDSKTYLLTLNTTSGLAARVCWEWNRRSFQNFPAELVIHYNPKTKAAEAGAFALIAFLKNADIRAAALKGDVLLVTGCGCSALSLRVQREPGMSLKTGRIPSSRWTG